MLISCDNYLPLGQKPTPFAPQLRCSRIATKSKSPESSEFPESLAPESISCIWNKRATPKHPRKEFVRERARCDAEMESE